MLRLLFLTISILCHLYCANSKQSACETCSVIHLYREEQFYTRETYLNFATKGISQHRFLRPFHCKTSIPQRGRCIWARKKRILRQEKTFFSCDIASAMMPPMNRCVIEFDRPWREIFFIETALQPTLVS